MLIRVDQKIRRSPRKSISHSRYIPSKNMAWLALIPPESILPTTPQPQPSPVPSLTSNIFTHPTENPQPQSIDDIASLISSDKRIQDTLSYCASTVNNSNLSSASKQSVTFKERASTFPSYSNVQGLPQFKQQLLTRLIYPKSHPFKPSSSSSRPEAHPQTLGGGAHSPILMYGPQGCGARHIIKATIKESNFKLSYLHLSHEYFMYSMMDKDYFTSIIEFATMLAPTLIYIADFEYLQHGTQKSNFFHVDSTQKLWPLFLALWQRLLFFVCCWLYCSSVWLAAADLGGRDGVSRALCTPHKSTVASLRKKARFLCAI